MSYRSNIARAKRMAASPLVKAAVACKGVRKRRGKKALVACHRRWKKYFKRLHRKHRRR